MGAVDFVARSTGLPLLREVKLLYGDRPDKSEDPIVFRGTWITGVSQIRYWTPGTTDPTGQPDGVIAANAIQRIITPSSAQDPLQATFYMYPPAGGWPEILEGTYMIVYAVRELVIGIDNDRYEDVKNAVVLMARHFYDGLGVIQPGHALHILVRRLRDYRQVDEQIELTLPVQEHVPVPEMFHRITYNSEPLLFGGVPLGINR